MMVQVKPKMHKSLRRAIIIGNGFAGAENQCYGLIRALGLSHRHSFFVSNLACFIIPFLFLIFEQRVRRPLNWLPASTHKALADHSDILELIATNVRETFHKHGPLLLVASGRDTISVAASIKRFAPDHVFAIQIQHPRSHLSRFDMVITPQHDYYPQTPQGKKQTPWFLRGWITPRQPPTKNVVLTLGALHQVDSDSLRVAASAWHDELASLCKPLLVVNIGGPIRHCRYGADLARQLIASLMNVLPTCGSIRISFTRRTPKRVSEFLVREFHNHPKVYIWDGKDPNPHMGHLAWGDAFVITADSVSMLSEACSTGKPVYVIGAERCTWKFAYFHQCLQERGVVRPFTGDENIAKTWTYPPLQDSAEAAEHVIQALAERGWNLQP